MAIDIKITSDDVIEHGGKQYRPVAFRLPRSGDLVFCGEVIKASIDFTKTAYLIIEEVIPPYRTPTDEDAKLRPMAEFWDGPQVPPNPTQGTLVAVVGGNLPFVIADERRVTSYRHCRIPNEQGDAT